MMSLKHALQKCWVIGLGLLFLLLFNQPAIALTIDDVPNPRITYGGWVVDQAQLFPSEVEQQFNQILTQVEQATGEEVAIVTVSRVAPAPSVEQFATQLFNRWGIGKRDRNNGLLILISKGDRRIEIKTGSGLTTLLPNATVKDIIDNLMVPHFREAEFVEGTFAGLEALLRMTVPDVMSQLELSEPNESLLSRLSPGSRFFLKVSLSVIVVALGALIVGLTRFLLPTFAKPGERSQRSGDGRDCQLTCTQCRLQMQQVDEATLQAALTEPQKVAQTIGSSIFEGWRCPSHCKQLTPPQTLHLREYIRGDRYQFQVCPHCQERTVIQTFEVLQAPTVVRPGTLLTQQECQACDFYEEEESEIPKLVHEGKSS